MLYELIVKMCQLQNPSHSIHTNVILPKTLSSKYGLDSLVRPLVL